MYPQDPQHFVGNNLWLNMEFSNEVYSLSPHSHSRSIADSPWCTKHTAAYPNGAYPQYGPEATFENIPFDTNSISHDEKPLALSSLDYAVAPVDIGPAKSVKPSFLPFAPEVGTQGVLDVPFVSSPADSVQTNLAYQQWWHAQHSGRSHSPEASQSYSETLSQEPWEYEYTLADAVETMPYGDGAFLAGESDRRSIHKRPRYEQPTYRIEGQDTRFMCTVENCGKNFSGEWEKKRHISSMHHPPTIGCRLCNYKQSRKDLFSEHCKKRHPGESIEELRVQLDADDA